DRGAAGAVVSSYDAYYLLSETGDLAAGPLLRLRRRPIRRVVLGERLVPTAGQTVVDAVPDQPGRSISRRAVDLQYTDIVGWHIGRLQMLDQRFGDRLADRLVVERHVEVRRGGRDRPVIGDDFHAL